MGSGTKTDPYRIEEQEFNVPEAVKAIKNHKIPKAVNEGTPNFALTATIDEGIYAMEDDYGTSYYFRGAVENNYVKFANLYWRIVRINGDGSLRLIYDGTKAYANGESNLNRIALTNIAFNVTDNDAKYVGYMYGPAGTTASTSKEEAQSNIENSTIKTNVDNWYKTNILDKGYETYISDEIFCNDRTIPGKNISNWGYDTELGYGNNPTAYTTWTKFGDDVLHPPSQSDPVPQFKCLNKNDAFTKHDIEKGNGNLTYPVGLITADEVVAAGSGKYGSSNSRYYLYKGYEYWLLSPLCNYIDGRTSAYMVHSNGSLYDYYMSTRVGAVPVINIKPEYAEKMIGDGTSTNPYHLEEYEFNVPSAVRAIKNNKVPKNINESSPNFAVTATNDEGVYSMEDDYGTSYYFRGSVINNYVKFAGFYWRIVRINGDGSLRIQYDGTIAHANGESNADRVALTNIEWNSGISPYDAKYVGYMYGETSNSYEESVC